MLNRLPTALVLSASLLIIACTPAWYDWNKAMAANTVAAYQAFVRKHPHDEHADDARGRVLALSDDQDWMMAQRSNTLESYQKYLQQEGGGVHADDARYQITALERAAAWKAMGSDASVAALQAFLQKYPQGPESNQARKKLEDLAYRVQLADTRSQAAAEHQRARLQARFGNVLHEVVVIPPSASDRLFKVASAPMSHADADSACAALARAHQRCKPVQTFTASLASTG
jgi:hypothetical protein